MLEFYALFFKQSDLDFDELWHDDHTGTNDDYEILTNLTAVKMEQYKNGVIDEE